MNSIKKTIGMCILFMCLIIAIGTVWLCMFGCYKIPDTTGGILVYDIEEPKDEKSI